MKSSLILKFLVLSGTSALVWLSQEPLSAVWAWFSDRAAVAATIDRLGVAGPLVLAVLFILQVFLAFIPGQALMVACGYLYGFWGGFLLSWLSLMAGGEAAFLLARRQGRSFAEKWISPGVLARWDKPAKGQGVLFYTVALVMPLVPNDAMCYLAGLGRIPHRHFTIANLFGRGMACAITSWIGAYGLQAPPHVWIIVAALAMLALLAWQLARHLQSRPYLW